MKRREGFETLKNLLRIKETPYGMQFRPKQQPRAVPKKLRKSRRRMVMMHDLYGQVKTTSSIVERAEAVQANLDSSFPSFVKPMIRSIVTKGFWLSLPKLFCELHLPEHDATVILEDENQKEYYTKYLAERRGLSGGWRAFSIAHNLVEGDVLVFHLVKFCKMKVYIIRADHLAEVDAALCLLHLDAHRRGMNSGKKRGDAGVLKSAGAQLQKSLPHEVSPGNYEKCIRNSNIRLVMSQPENICEVLQLALEGLISETYRIASTFRASKTKALPNDCATWNKHLIDYQQMRSNLEKVQAEMDQLVCLVIEWSEARHSQNEGGGGGYTNNLSIKVLELKEAI